MARLVDLKRGPHGVIQLRHARTSSCESQEGNIRNTRSPCLCGDNYRPKRSPAVAGNTTFMVCRERAAEARIDVVRNRVNNLLSSCSPIRSFCFHRGMMMSSNIVTCPRQTLVVRPTGSGMPL